jgi:hypothetical protein
LQVRFENDLVAIQQGQLDPVRIREARRARWFPALALFATLAACTGASSVPASTSAPTPVYTQAQSDACASDVLKVDFAGEATAAEKLYYTTLGDLTTARKQAAKVSASEAKIVAAFTGTGADAEAEALHSALMTGAAAFAKPMTRDQFDAAYKAITDANQAFDDECRQIAYWVEQNVPH